MSTIPTPAELTLLAQERGLALPAAPPPAPGRPLIIAHRGASGYLPEHTLAAYGLAILLGADFIEPDLVMTRDGHLIARHDNLLDLTTDVAQHPQFAARRGRKIIDGVPLHGWFAEDFTLAEIRQLRARERIPLLRPGNTRYDGAFGVPTLSEILELVRRMEPVVGRRIGLYPETKHPSYFRQLGLALEEPLVAMLHAAGYRDRDAPIFLQSFEIGNLQRLRELTQLPLIQLLGEAHERPFDAVLDDSGVCYADMMTPAGLQAIAVYANGIGPDKTLVLPDVDGQQAPSPGRSMLVDSAHACGLAVHPYTFRAENHFLPTVCQRGGDITALGDGAGEIARFIAAGVDGFFTDHPDLGVRATLAHR